MFDVYKVTLGGQAVGFFTASTWSDAAKQAARHHGEKAGEKLPWVNFTATWVNPKHYEALGVPPALYAVEEDAEA